MYSLLRAHMYITCTFEEFQHLCMYLHAQTIIIVLQLLLHVLMPVYMCVGAVTR